MAQQGVEQGGIAVRGFDAELGLPLLPRLLFQVAQHLAALGILGWQVAVEGEMLAIQAAAHEGEEEG